MDAIIDPNNSILHLKYILFGLIVLFWVSGKFFEKFNIPPNLLVFTIIFISFFLPFYALSIGFINNFLQNTDIETIVYFNSFFFFLLIIIVLDKNYDLTKILNYSSLLIIIITIGSYCVLVLHPSTFVILVKYLVIDKNVAAFGFREYGDVTILMMYFRTSPLLVFPLAYFLHRLFINKNKKNFLLQLIALISIVFTLILSGTRANFLSLVFIVLFYIFFWSFKKSKKIFFLLCFAFLIFSIYEISSVITLLFDKNELSNSIKHGHLQSYIEYFSTNTLQLITGQGLGGSFYSLGFNKLTTVTELTYLEIIRIWGLPISLIFMFVLSLPIIKEIKSKNISPLFIAYIAYLFIAGTNPFLLSSTGMMVLVYVFSKIFMENVQVDKPNKILI